MEGLSRLSEVWTVKPKQDCEFVLRRCARCDQKSEFVSSRKFRVNANGKALDVWLIYNCVTCKKSWNFSVMERVHVSAIDKCLLERYMANDEELARSIGLRQMREHEDFEIQKQIILPDQNLKMIRIEVSEDIKVRADKVLAAGLGVTRSHLLRLAKAGGIELQNGADGIRFLKKPVRMGQVFEVSNVKL